MPGFGLKSVKTRLATTRQLEHRPSPVPSEDSTRQCPGRLRPPREATSSRILATATAIGLGTSPHPVVGDVADRFERRSATPASTLRIGLSLQAWTLTESLITVDRYERYHRSRRVTAERSELANRVAAIDKILHAVAALDGSVSASGTIGSTGTGRQRRTNQEVEAIKTAIEAELSREPGSKNDISQRLQAKGILTGSRRDRELVQRTLKELVESEAASLVVDTYTSTRDGHRVG